MEYSKRPEADLRLKYPLYCETGLVLVLLAFIVLFVVSKEHRPRISIRPQVVPDFTVQIIPITRQTKARPRPPRPVFVPQEGSADPVDDELLLAMEQDDWTVPLAPPPPLADMTDEIVPFYAVERKPEMQGGVTALYSRIEYPELALHVGAAGVTRIEFVVDLEGLPGEFTVLEEDPVGLGFAEAAIAALRKMTFKPGLQRDRSVAVRMSQVVRFELGR